MGLNYTEVRQLLAARQAGADFRRVLTVGRQQVFLRPHDVEALNEEFGPGAIPLHLVSEGDYGERMFCEVFGVEQLDAIDASPYEGATIVHDLNLPVDSSRERSYSFVIDGGSLEHIFNVPVA